LTPPPDELAVAALRAACIAYAPYTGALAGVAIQIHSGQAFNGAYVENAAFNPSISPMQTAIVALALTGRSAGEVTEAAIVQMQESKIDHAAAARLVLAHFAPDVILQQYRVRLGQ